MEIQTQNQAFQKKDREVKVNLYLISILLLMFILPVLSILIEFVFRKVSMDPSLIGKWFLFWSVGIRLTLAGLRQVVRPAFTAEHIFHMTNPEVYIVIRELGFANIGLGISGMISLFNLGFRMPVALMAGLFFGLAGIQHLFKKPDSNNETIAMYSDLFLFVIMLMYLFSTFLK